MQLHFLLNYRAVWGQILLIQLFDKKNQSTEYEMKCIADDQWKISISKNEENTTTSYRYLIKNTNGITLPERNGRRIIEDSYSKKDQYFIDFWRDFNGENVFNSIAFTECFFKRKRNFRV